MCFSAGDSAEKTNAVDKSRICDRRSSSDALAQNYGKQVGARSLYYSIKKNNNKTTETKQDGCEFQIHNIEPNLKTIVICKDENFPHYA